MRREIAPEMYNYNKFPGPTFQVIGQEIVADDLSFTLLENYREAFDLEKFQQRYSEILLKYDYILGDRSSDELRLTGFYKDDRTKISQWKISRLDDYLKEYCNFGCAYFILENPEPHLPRSESDRSSRAKGHYHKQPRKKEAEAKREGFRRKKKEAPSNRLKSSPVNAKNTKSSAKQPKAKKKIPTNKPSEQQHFTIRKKE